MNIVRNAFMNTWKVFLLFVLFVLSGNIFFITITAECQDTRNSWKFALNDEYYEKLWPGCGINHPPPPSAIVKERVDLHFCSPCVPSWKVVGWTSPFAMRNFAWRRVLEKQIGHQLDKKFPSCKGTRSSLSYLQQPTACPSSEPGKSIPHHPICFFSINFKVILPYMPRCSKWSLSF